MNNKLNNILTQLAKTFPKVFGKYAAETVDVLTKEMTYEELYDAYISKGLDHDKAHNFAQRDILQQTLRAKNAKKHTLEATIKNDEQRKEEDETKRKDIQRYNSHALSIDKIYDYTEQFKEVHNLLQDAYMIDNRSTAEKRWANARFDKIELEMKIKENRFMIYISFDKEFETRSSQSSSNTDQYKKGINYSIDTDYKNFQESLQRKVYDTVGLFPAGRLPETKELNFSRLFLEEDGRCDVSAGKRKYIVKAKDKYEKDTEKNYAGLYPEEIVMLLIMDGVLTKEKVESLLNELTEKQVDYLKKSLEEVEEETKELDEKVKTL